ncbi:MAG: hypothetical protein U5K76_15455 [Woeseiaceae bacterium]|nr:hypothetical protein [Woeseiaceae bacterium]
MRTLIVPGIVALVSACTPLTERERQDREYERGEFRAQYLEFKAACEAQGGTVVIRSRRRIGPDRIPNPGDYYRCEAP